MQNSAQLIVLFRKLTLAASAGSLALALCVAGCSSTTTNGSSNSSSSNSTTMQQTAPVYMAPAVSGTTYATLNFATGNGSTQPLLSPLVYSLDETNGVFQQTDYDMLDNPAFAGNVVTQTFNLGNVAAGQRGLRTLVTSESYYLQTGGTNAKGQTGQTGWFPATYGPPLYPSGLTGGFAVELSGQAGGFVQLTGQPAAPVIDAVQCPASATQTYQFITVPIVSTTDPARIGPYWHPATETAYGSVDVSSSGSTVTFQHINQFTLNGTSAGQLPASSPLPTGICGPTSFGNVTNVPGQLVISNPGSSQPSETTTPQAMIGIGANNGLLVEDNGNSQAVDGGTMPKTSPPLSYENILGAGTGAVGLAKPSGPLGTRPVAGTTAPQYLGFIYSPGALSPAKSWSSHLASFSYSSTSPRCASFAAQTGPLVNGIYGGDYTNDDPSTSPDGYGNCDFAVDLGPEDSANYGLYPGATVWMGATYAANTTATTYSFPAVAIAGQINGKYAIFLIGYDSTQPWSIYLLESIK